MKNYGLRFKIGDRVFRFCSAEEAILVEEQFPDGNKEFFYIPYILNVNYRQGKLSFRQSSNVQSFSCNIWDGKKDIYNEFEQVNEEFQEIESHFILFNDSEIDKKFPINITDVSHGHGEISLTLRGNKQGDINDIFTKFTPSTFQSFEIKTPHDIHVTPFFDIDENSSWKIAEWKDPNYNVRNASGYGEGDWFEGGALSIKHLIAREYYDTNSGKWLKKFTGSQENITKISCKKAPYGYKNNYFTYTYNPSTDQLEMANYNKITDLSDGHYYLGQPGADNYEKFSVPDNNTDVSLDNKGRVILENSNGFNLSGRHLHNEPITPTNANDDADVHDVVWAKTNGYFPHDYQGDPNLAVGFINIGGQSYQFFDNEEKSPILYRFEVDSLEGDYVKLLIHDTLADSGHEFSVDFDEFGMGVDDAHLTRMNNAQIKIATFPRFNGSKDKIVPGGTNINICSLNWLLKNMLFQLDVYNDSFSNYYTKNEFSDRYKGIRFDQLEKDYKDEVNFKNENNQNYKQVNKNFINTGSKNFGVATGSDILKGDILSGLPLFSDLDECKFYEVVDFNKKMNINRVSTLVEDDTDDKEIVDDKEKVIPNYLTYKPDYESVQDIKDDSNSELLQQEKAIDYFKKQKYRVAHNPVPRDQNDLGKVFPIAYGHLKKVPVLHVVGKNVFPNLRSSIGTSVGGDVYIYARNECNVSNDEDITIYLPEEKYEDEGGETITHLRNLIESPFPNVIEDHYELVEEGGGSDNKRPKYIGDINTPYHKVDSYQTNHGEKLYGFELEGDKWEKKLGPLDKRFAVRHGVGSTPLFASFSGAQDDGSITGNRDKVLVHPLNILQHFVNNYTKFSKDEILDMDGIDDVLSRTKHHVASIYINEETDLFKLSSKIAKQFGYYVFRKNGRISFSRGERSSIQYNKPIVQGLNVVTKPEKKSEGYKQFHNIIEYNFQKNWMRNKYDTNIILDKTNNKYCAKVSKVKDNKSRFSVNADFVHKTEIAKEVSNIYAERFGSKRASFSVDVKRGGRINDLEPGDYVPMTLPEYNINEEPVLVKSVEYTDNIQNCELVKFFEL